MGFSINEHIINDKPSLTTLAMNGKNVRQLLIQQPLIQQLLIQQSLIQQWLFSNIYNERFRKVRYCSCHYRTWKKLFLKIMKMPMDIHYKSSFVNICKLSGTKQSNYKPLSLTLILVWIIKMFYLNSTPFRGWYPDLKLIWSSGVSELPSSTFSTFTSSLNISWVVVILIVSSWNLIAL